MAESYAGIYTVFLQIVNAGQRQKINKDCRRSAVFAVFCDLLNLGETIVLSDNFLYYCLLWLYYIVILPASKIKKAHAYVQNSSCSRTAEFGVIHDIIPVNYHEQFVSGNIFTNSHLVIFKEVFMSLTKYQILISALEHGSLTAAAEELGYTQSGVTHMLNSLESELGVQLVIRSRTGVRPTATGEILIPYIKRVLNAEQNFVQALSEITGLLRGKLTIGTFVTASSFYLPEIISEFQQKYPHINYELRNGTYEEIEQWIENREVDCGFVSLPTRSNFKYVPVINDRLVVAAGKEYRHHFKDTNSITIEELQNEDIILIDGKSDYDVIRIFSNAVNKLNVKATVEDSYSTIKMIENNLGVGLLPVYLADHFKDSINIYELENASCRTLAFAYLNKKEASPIAKKFISFIESGHHNITEMPEEA